MIEIYRYVPHDLVLDYFRLGWMWIADLGPIHGHYSCLMGWPCQCEIVEPVRGLL
jgi:hypothetical protein